MKRSFSKSPPVPVRCAAFTLIEMLVVIGILLLLSAMTLSVVNVATTGDRTRGAARQVQSYLEGARGRAIYGGKQKGSSYQCGVRFIPELPAWERGKTYAAVGTKVLPAARGTGFVYELTATAPPNQAGLYEPVWPITVGNTVTDGNLTWTCRADHILVTSLQYVENDPTATSITGGTIALARPDVNNDNVADSPDVVRIIGNPHSRYPGASGQPTKWFQRYLLGLIYHGQTVVLNNRKYQISLQNLTPNDEELVLTTPYIGTLNTGVTATDVVVVTGALAPTCELLLPPQPMPNQEPRSLGNGVVLDLSLSNGLSSLLVNSQRMDVMFSPRGTVVGPLAGTGIVEFTISDREDALKQIPLPTTLTPNPQPKRERMIISLTPQTGKAAVHPIYIDPTGANPDPFRYAETGEVAQQ